MSEPITRPSGDESSIPGVLAILVVGTVLGVAFNWFGLRGQPGFGIPWKGSPPEVVSLEDAMDGTEDAAAAATAPDDGYIDVDDPRAMLMEEDPGLPEIPVLDRPIQMQLSVVKKFFDANGALFVDAREPYEFDEGHIPGAINLPFDVALSEPETLAALPVGGRPVIVYCGGGDCELSIKIAEELIFAGHGRVTYFQGGMPEWIENGYPVSSGEGGA